MAVVLAACLMQLPTICVLTGVGWVRLQAPFGEVDVLNTHLHANYSHEDEALPRGLRIDPMYDAQLRVPADDNACYRVAQVGAWAWPPQAAAALSAVTLQGPTAAWLRAWSRLQHFALTQAEVVGLCAQAQFTATLLWSPRHANAERW